MKLLVFIFSFFISSIVCSANTICNSFTGRQQTSIAIEGASCLVPLFRINKESPINEKNCQKMQGVVSGQYCSIPIQQVQKFYFNFIINTTFKPVSNMDEVSLVPFCNSLDSKYTKLTLSSGDEVYFCDHTEKLKCEGVDRSDIKKWKKRTADWKKNEDGQFECIPKDNKKCRAFDPEKDCTPKQQDGLTELFIHGVGLISANKGNSCASMMLQILPQTKAYRKAVSTCQKNTAFACRKIGKSGQLNCTELCPVYKENLKAVKDAELKSTIAYEKAFTCMQQTKTDFKGYAEQCNIVTALNREQCCYLPKHLNSPLCNVGDSYEFSSPQLGSSPKSNNPDGGIDFLDGELPSVTPPHESSNKYDPSVSPSKAASSGGGAVGGGIGGSPYTNNDDPNSTLGRRLKSAFQAFLPGGSWSKKRSKSDKYYPGGSYYKGKKIIDKRAKNLDQSQKKASRSIAQKRARSIFERISDVYKSLVHQRKLVHQKDPKGEK